LPKLCEIWKKGDLKMEIIYDFGDDDQSKEYDFEPSDKDESEAIDDILFKKSPKELIEIIHDLSDTEKLEEYLEDELKDWFEQIAKNEYKDTSLEGDERDEYSIAKRRI
jgi:hypothetical protein